MENVREIRLLRELITHGLWDEVADTCARMYVQDIAEALSGVQDEALPKAFMILPEDQHAGVFAYIELPVQHRLLEMLDDEAGRKLMAGLSPDDRTALLQSVNKEEAEQLLRLLSADDMRVALELLGYPAHSVGRLMTTRFVTLRPDWSLSEALAHVRRQGQGEETINTLYVTDARGHLAGTVSLKRLVMLAPEETVGQVVSGPLVTVQAAEDRTEAVRLIQHYDITALPVVDSRGILLGVVTVDDVMDVAEAENTEDFHKIGGVGAVALSLRDARPSLLYRKRVGWLVLLVFMNIFGGAGIAYFEETIEAVIALVFFLPLIVDSGGNAGSQSATLMVRALATGDVQSKDWLKLWGKELGVALALGLTMGAAVWGLGLWRGGSEVALVVSLAMVLVVMMGSMIGMLLPFLLTRMKFDPATASAPLITSIADIAGILIYFSIATAILTIPTT